MQLFEIVIGRKDQNDFQIKHTTVSSKHAILYGRGKDLYITDLQSTNGTFFKEDDSWVRIENDKAVDLGSEILFGGSEPVFVFDILYSCLDTINKHDYFKNLVDNYKEQDIEKSAIYRRCMNCAEVFNIKLKICPECRR